VVARLASSKNDEVVRVLALAYLGRLGYDE